MLKKCKQCQKPTLFITGALNHLITYVLNFVNHLNWKNIFKLKNKKMVKPNYVTTSYGLEGL